MLVQSNGFFKGDSTDELNYQSNLFKNTIGGYKIGFLGDSHTANQGTDTSHTEKGYATFVHLLSKGKFKNIYYGATGGYTTAQIISTHLDNLIASKPDICVVLAGTNDTATGVDLNAITKPNLIYIYNKLLLNNIIPIACTIPPRTVASGFQDEVAEMNNWIIYYCQKNGIQVIDFHSVLVDPSTGEFKSTHHIGDGVHMNGNGAKAAAQLFVDTVSSRLPANSIRFTTYSNDPKNLIGNGCFTVDTNSDGTPDSWSVSWGLGSGSEATRSLVTPSESDVIGKWFQIVKVGTSAGSMRSSTITLTPGRKYQFSGKIKVSNVLINDYTTASGTVTIATGKTVYNSPVSSGGGTVKHFYRAKSDLTNVNTATENYADTARWDDVTSGTGYNGVTVLADGSKGISVGLIDVDQSTYNYQTAYYTSITDVTGAFCIDFVCPTGRTKAAIDIAYAANTSGTISLAQLTLMDITDY